MCWTYQSTCLGKNEAKKSLIFVLCLNIHNLYNTHDKTIGYMYIYTGMLAGK